MTAARRPESQEQILEAAVASLTEADIPPDEEDYGWRDPDVEPPAELVSLSDAELEELLADAPARPERPAWPLSYRSPDGPDGPPWPAASGPGDGAGGGLGFSGGAGAGFADGGPLDALPAGMTLAGFADEAYSRAGELDDDCLVGVLRAWRRLASWAQARELAAVAALARRRPADGTPPAARPDEFPAKLSEFIAAEVAAALTLTGQAAGAELDLALDLAARPATAAELEAGRIDLPRAKILTSMLGPLSPAQADAVEAQILPRAAEMTTGQLRAALQRAVLDADPAAARRRREQAEQEARVEHWADPEGTATLAGRCLPPAAALTASTRLTQIAAAWKKHGAIGGMDLLRAHAYLALLNGQSVDAPPASLLPGLPVSCRSCADDMPASGPRDDPATGGRPHVPAGLRGPGPGGPGPGGLPPTAGLINLTVPLTTLLGLADAPGEAAGYGPVDADTVRLLARVLAGQPATRWQITVTGPDGHALAHGTARGPAFPARDGPGRGWTVAVTAEPIAAGSCDHRNAEPGYRPGPALQRLIRARTRTCAGPGCRRPAARCDLDHTIPHDDDGLTCECNLAPLCRFCHRLKQAEGWTLTQASPGIMIWTTPTGRRYTTLPSKQPT